MLAFYKEKEINTQKWVDAQYQEWLKQPKDTLKIVSKSDQILWVGGPNLKPIDNTSIAIPPGSSQTFQAPHN